MDEKLKDIQKKAVEFWKKYDKKQKTLMISITAAVLITLIIMAIVLTRPTYKLLIECADAVEAADVTDALTEEGIEYTTENEGLNIYVEEENYTNATYLIAQDGIVARAFTLEAYMENVGFSTTKEDKDRMWQKYLEDNMRLTIESFDYVKSADVMFTIPKDTLSVLEDDEETYVSVKLQLKNSMPNGAASSMAQFIATAVGNPTTNNVTIIDSTGNTLFQGSSNYTDGSTLSVSAQDAIRNRFYNETVSNVYKALSDTGLFSNISVSPNLNITFDKTDVVDTEYYNPDEVIDNEYTYTSEGASTSGGVPGTDSNDDDTTYYIPTGDGTNTSVEIRKTDYAVSQKITSTQGEQGTCDREKSTIAVTVNDYIYHNYDQLEEKGALDDMTWEEYKEANSTIVSMDIDPIMYTIVSKATGIPEENITIYGTIIPVFEESADDGSFVTNILPIIIAVVILLLLGFMVWRSLRPIEVNEVEPELSVEELLSATRDKQAPVEDIDLEEKSETRKAIEKFVDENPEAAALLLRNWLNDDWE